MGYMIVGLISFLVGYVLCFKFMRDDIVHGKPIVFKRGVYVASKVSRFK